MTLSIREMTPKDLSGVVKLMTDFAEYEKLAEYCTVTEERIQKAIFGDKAIVRGLVAADGEDLAGYALFYPCFSSFRGERGVYLEDIYIDAKYRGGGSGKLMLERIAAIAAEDGAERIDFQVLDWNAPAIDFYRKLGAVSNDGETHFKFAGDAFAALARTEARS